jgi:hypothetical protein
MRGSSAQDLRELDDPALQGYRDSVSSVMGAEFRQDVLDSGLDRVLSDVKPIADQLVRVAGSDEVQDIIAIIASRPLISGICRSINVTSGRNFGNCWIASRPLEHAPASVTSDSAAMSAAMP